MLRRSIVAGLLLAFIAARPATSVLTDDEPSNDAIQPEAVQMFPTAEVTTDGGEFVLVFDDVDYIGISNLVNGDIVTVSTTPLDDERFADPDTYLALFTSGGSAKCVNDDTNTNNELGNPATTGLGSLCRFVIDADGTWYVGVTGAQNPDFDDIHFEDGLYEVHVTINAVARPFPTGTPTATPVATPTALPTTFPTPTPTATSTPTSTSIPTAAPTATPTSTPSGTPGASPTPTPTPEPGLLLQLASGLLGLAMLDRRRRNTSR